MLPGTTVTDQQGRFYIPARSSSLPTQTDTYLLGIDPRIVMQKPQPEDLDSRIILFKPGYAYNRAANNRHSNKCNFHLNIKNRLNSDEDTL